MHILPRNKLSGAENVALLICENLKDYDCIVVCGGESLKEVFSKRGITAYSVSFESKHFIKSIKIIYDICKEEEVKLIHAHDNLASIYSYVLKKLLINKTKVVSHIHSAYPFIKNKSLLKLIDSYFRPKYDFNILCGKLVLDYYLKNTTYFLESKSEILSNSINVELIQNFKRQCSGELKKELGIVENKKVIGFCGRLCEIKGLIPFIIELEKNKKKFENCIFLIVGSGELEEEIKQLIDRLNLKDKFILTGFQEETFPYYSIMDIFFLPSLYEGLPMVLLEAMAFEKTVVSMNVGGIGELIKNKENGYLVEGENYKEFINTLLYAIQNYDSDQNLRDLAFKNVDDDYNINTYCANLNKIYRKVIT